MQRFVTLWLAAFVVILVSTAELSAQATVIKGTVSDNTGRMLSGVRVRERATLRGAITSHGSFTLLATSPNAVLIFRAAGYRVLEYPLAGKTDVAVKLEPIGTMETSTDGVTVVGSRNSARSETETAVPVDVIEVAELRTQLPQADVNQLLQYLAPSFNASRQSGADGSDHIDPASLRGLGPDQTLVLLNGKRQHQSSLVNIFGSRGRGNTGTDLNAIPTSAIERLEILRDGASAQYGSDAIAGVMNIILKSSVNELTVSAMTGVSESKYRKDLSYDGEQAQVGLNYGIPVGDGGFVNFSADYLRRGRTNRPPASDTMAIYRRQFGDAAGDNLGFFLNTVIPAGNNSQFYAFGGFNYRFTDAYAWTRDSSDATRNVASIYPLGFDPHIQSIITDPSLSFGVRSSVAGWKIDINNTYGSNRFHFLVDGTLNSSLGDRSPTHFDAGGFYLTQNTVCADFARVFPSVAKGMNVAWGLEYRLENYGIFAGEEASWKNYGIVDSVVGGVVVPRDVLGRAAGSQGFPGFRPDNVVDEFRSNIAVYADAELDLTEQLLLNAAARFEQYSDFGSTLTGKFAARYKLSNELTIRAAASTGFRAPSLAQIYYNTVFTDFVGGVATDKIIARNNSPITRTLGVPALKEETSVNISGGITYEPFEGFTATVDGYLINIKDRIVLTGAFSDSDSLIGKDLQRLGVAAAQFFTNALDTKTKGIDVVLAYSHTFDDQMYRLTLAANVNDIELGDIRTSPRLTGKEDTYFGRREQFFLLASAPPYKAVLTAEYGIGNFRGLVRGTMFGGVELVDWADEIDKYDPKMVLDASVSYSFSPGMSVVLGVSNFLNAYPTEQNTDTETGGIFDAVQMGFAGRQYFARLNIRL